MSKKLYKSKKDIKLDGVCAGIADYFSLDPTLVRLIWAVGTVMSAGTGIVLYIIGSVILPRADDSDYYDPQRQ